MARWDKEQYEEAGSPRVNPIVAKEYDPSFVDITARLVASGATEKEVAFILGTSRDNIRAWKRDYPEFKNALLRGKEAILQRVIGAGIKAAEGGWKANTTITGKQVVLADGTLKDWVPGQTVDVKVENKYIPPNHNILMFLANTISKQLGSDDWISKNMSETKVTGEVVHKLDATAIQKQIEEQGAKLIKHVDSEIIENE